MTPTEFLENTFFAYFFGSQGYIPVLFAFTIVVVFLVGILNFILGTGKEN